MKAMSHAVLTLAAWLGSASGCSEPTRPGDAAADAPARPGIPAVNTAPRVFAGPDAWVPLLSGVVLSGYARDAESDVSSYSWQKVSGPGSYSIESQKSRRTRVNNLENGEYAFELTATDRGGLNGRDTVSVFVYDPRTSDASVIIYRNVRWECPMGCSLSIEDLRAYVPDGASFRVFVAGRDDPGWVQAKTNKEWTADDKYLYEISNDKLHVGSNYESETANVKLELRLQSR